MSAVVLKVTTLTAAQRMPRKRRPDNTREFATTGPQPAWGPAEFAREFKSSFRLLWLIAVGIVKDGALAEDIVQEAALIGLEKMGEFTPGSNFAAWMGKTVRFVAFNQARKESRRRGLPMTEDEFDPDVTTDAAFSIGNAEQWRRGELPEDQGHFDDRVVAALRGISPVARACLLLRTLEGLEYSDIAALLEIPEGTAMSHVHRARIFLRQKLGGTAPTAAGPEGRA